MSTWLPIPCLCACKGNVRLSPIEYYAKGTALMTPEERQKFFTERLDQNKEARSKQLEQVQQMQSEIETLRSFSLESESNRNILQIQGNTN